MKMVTCVIVGPDYEPVPVDEMTLEQAKEAIRVLLAENRSLERSNQSAREVTRMIVEGRESRRRWWSL